MGENLAELERGLRAALARNPDDFAASLQLGIILSRGDRYEESLAAFDRAASLNPGHPGPFTLQAMAVFRHHFGPPVSPRTRPALQRAVSMRTLGINGKFGNQILQYAFLRLYAQQHGLVAEAADWIGRDLFDLDDPLPGTPWPEVNEEKADLFAALNDPGGKAYANHDLVGYFCQHTSRWQGREGAFRQLFSPGAKTRDLLRQAMDKLRGRGETIIAIHLRRGDFGYGPFWIAPASWYRVWLDSFWATLKNPVLYVSSDDPGMAREFAEFQPMDAAMLGVVLPGAEFYLDHFIMSQADHLAISNSSFSFTAAMLNQKARSFVRPAPNAKALVDFAPWDAEVMLRVELAANSTSREQEMIAAQWIQPGDTVLYVGEFCAPWTTLIRARHPNLKVIEVSQEAGLDDVRGQLHIRHLIAGHPDLARLIEGMAQTLKHARVDHLHFQSGESLGPVMRQLEALGYRIFRVTLTGLQPFSAALPGKAGPLVAIQERLLPLVLRQQTTGLNLPALCAQHHVKVRGVIHVGAHEGRELAAYRKLGAERVLFIEANPAVFSRLAAAMANEKDVIAVNRAVCDRAGKIDMHLASFDQSSSLLPMHRHREVYPQIVPAGTVSVDAVTLDGLMAELGLAMSDFNFLAIDVQGAEALVLKGAPQTLAHIDAISVEVNFTDLYRGGAEIEDIESLLGEKGFKRVSLISPYHPSWGDALYICGGRQS